MRVTLRQLALSLSLAFLPALTAILQAQTVTITPGYTTIGVNQQLQYSAAVTGLPSTAVKWYVSGKLGGAAATGTISTNGLYTAPAVVPTNGITVSAIGSDNQTMGIVYVNVARPGPTITSITPSPIPTGSYAVTITGTSFKANSTYVMINGVSLSVTYVNPTTIKVVGYQPTAGTFAFQASSDSSLLGAPYMATFVKAGPPAPQSISPSAASMNLGGTQQFTSTGATSFTASVGSITSTGLYTAPATMPASSNVKITATGPGGTATANINLINPNPQVISPSTASVALGGTQQFTSTGATSWMTSAGTISSTGLYTAPASLPANGIATISVTGSNGTANATVSLVPPTPSITAIGNGTLPLGVFSATITGTGIIPSTTAQMAGANLSSTYTNGSLKVSGFYGKSGPASITIANGSLTSAPFQVQVGIKQALASAAASRRFLEQAAFGPTPNDAAHVQTIGMTAWINEQIAMPKVSTYAGITSSQGGMPTHFLTDAVMNPDQLRQRVGFALSEIFVTSISKLIWNENIAPFQDMLLTDSFSNFRQIMGDVTLSPAMGQYLDMANNARAVPGTGAVANENYAREIMQLFTLGTNLLNQDGTLQLDSQGLPMPSYSQLQVTEFARVYTGWTYPPAPGYTAQWNASPDGNVSHNSPMVAITSQHDFGSKQLLRNYVSPANITPLQDINNALDNIFNHPNVGPFIATQMIQHLVKSNPSPTYVSHVAAAFNDDGSTQHVRGNMQAVITAVLMDAEARANDEGGNDLMSDGHLQEPALFFPGMIRAFGGTMNDQNYYSGVLSELGEDVYNSPSVFNYFAPNFGVPGTSLLGGEFQLHTPNASIVRANDVAALMYSQYANPIQTYGPGTTVDLTPFVALAATPSTLIDALDLTLTHGTMPQAMKNTIITAVNSDSNKGVHQVQTACYLILSSNYYNVWH
jgi:uncharacterized protein (DUF1800 family)